MNTVLQEQYYNSTNGWGFNGCVGVRYIHIPTGYWCMVGFVCYRHAKEQKRLLCRDDAGKDVNSDHWMYITGVDPKMLKGGWRDIKRVESYD